jgi:hypothetical protein
MKGSVRHCFRVPTTEELIQDLTPAQLRSLAVTMAEIVAPYGVVEADTIEPASFQELSERLLASAPGREDPNELAADCHEIIERFVDDEPADAGW